MNDLVRLKELLAARNNLDAEISRIIGRPALTGHIAEYIASQVFSIDLHASAAHRGSDGIFRAGELAGKNVNVKWYGRQEGILDVGPHSLVDFILVMTGPKSQPGSSRGKVRPFVINSVYLFDAKRLTSDLEQHGVRIGIATSVKRDYWDSAEVYPNQRSLLLGLDERQRKILGLFAE